MINVNNILVRKPEGIRLDERIILKWILTKIRFEVVD
jgi:hypothetical protein